MSGEPTRKQVDFVRLSQGTTRAHATDLLAHDYQLPDDWEEQLADLYRQAAESEAAVRSAERVPRKRTPVPAQDQPEAQG